MGAPGKGRARRGAQAKRAAPDPAEADPTTRSADHLARGQHVEGKVGGTQARVKESPAFAKLQVGGHGGGRGRVGKQTL